MSAWDKIYLKSCERMDDLSDGEVSLTVTSPPYWNAIDYGIHAADPSREENYRQRQYKEGFEGYEDYLDWITKISCEVLRVTKPGGFFALVVGTVLLDGRYYPLPSDVAYRLTRAGWLYHQDLTWCKVTAGARRAGVFIQKNYPGYYYPNIMAESIIVLRKPGPPIYQGRSAEEKQAAQVPLTDLMKKEILNNVWHIAPVPPGLIDHPCPFPEEIPWRLTLLYSYPGDLVLDPFAGSGQTLKVAHYMGRRFVGYETVEKYVELALSRLEEPPKIRRAQIVPVYSHIPLGWANAQMSGNDKLVANT